MAKREINPKVQKQVKGFFRQLNMLFGVFLAGVLMFLVSVMIVVYYRVPENHDLDTILLFAAPISTAALLLISHRLFMSRLKSAGELEKLFQKMEAYRGAIVLRYLLLDGAIFLQIIAYLLTENKLFVVLSVVVISMFMLYRPNARRFTKEMALSELETEVIMDHSV